MSTTRTADSAPKVLTPPAALDLAVRRIGSQSETARLLGIGQAAISKWLSRKKPAPAEYVLKIEERSGVSRHQLRPDLYPVDLAPPSEHLPPAGRTLAGAAPIGCVNRGGKLSLGEPVR